MSRFRRQFPPALSSALRGAVDRATDLGLARLRSPDQQLQVHFGAIPQVGGLMLTLRHRDCWRQASSREKLEILFHGASPSAEAIANATEEAARNLIVGHPGELGDHLFELFVAHQETPWDLSWLTSADRDRGFALESASNLTRQRLRTDGDIPHLTLGVVESAPTIAMLVFPMAPIFPIYSVHHFVDMHAMYAFNEIRRSEHPESDGLIAFLYDLLFLNQKIALVLDNAIQLAISVSSGTQSEQALHNHHVNFIISLDTLFSYLKASLEKTVYLVGLTHGIKGLANKKEHRKRMSQLARDLPDTVKRLHYCDFFLEFASSEMLEELNNFRNGVLHKRGIANLQPHTYLSKAPGDLPVIELADFVHDQHRKNSAILLCALAMLVDDLVRRGLEPSLSTALFDSFLRFAESELSPEAIARRDAKGERVQRVRPARDDLIGPFPPPRAESSDNEGA